MKRRVKVGHDDIHLNGFCPPGTPLDGAHLVA